MDESCFAVMLDVFIDVVISPVDISLSEGNNINVEGLHLFNV